MATTRSWPSRWNWFAAAINQPDHSRGKRVKTRLNSNRPGREQFSCSVSSPYAGPDARKFDAGAMVAAGAQEHPGSSGNSGSVAYSDLEGLASHHWVSVECRWIRRGMFFPLGFVFPAQVCCQGGHGFYNPSTPQCWPCIVPITEY